MTLSAVPRHGGNYSTNFNPNEVGEYMPPVLEICGTWIAQVEMFTLSLFFLSYSNPAEL